MKRLLWAVGSAVIGLVSISAWTPTVAAGPVAESTVAVLTNPDYVDMGEIADGGEVVNLIADLEAGGHTVREFTDISAAGFAAALDGADVLALPELEGEEELYDDLTAEASAVIADFVDGGGRLLLFWAPDASLGLDALFGITTAPSMGCDEDVDPCARTAEAAATEFADGPASLQGVNATATLLTSSLPAGSTVIYAGQVEEDEEEELLAAALVGVAAVAAVPVGDGAVITFGWDWYPDAEQEDDDLAAEGLAPAAAEDEAAWATVLDLAASQPQVTASSPAAGQLLLTSDAPSVQPVLVAVVVDGETTVAEIPVGSTSVTLAVTGPVTVGFTVPGWGIGEGSVAVAGAAVAPPPSGGPAQPVPASPSFTG